MRNGLTRGNALAVLAEASHSRRYTNSETVALLEAAGIDLDDLRPSKERVAADLWRRLRDKAYQEGDLANAPVNLFEITEEGKKHYWKFGHALTPDESAKHLDSLQRGINKDCSRLHEWERFLFGIHGEERINQLRLEFPER